MPSDAHTMASLGMTMSREGIGMVGISVHIVPMTSCAEHVEWYACLVCPGMSIEDVLDQDEMVARLDTGRVLAWWVMAGQDVAGWCAMVPDHGKHDPRSWHLFGGWVADAMRGRGIARSMWEHRMSLVPPGRAVTVCIQPGKEGSLALARRFGFKCTGGSEVWFDYMLDAHVLQLPASITADEEAMARCVSSQDGPAQRCPVEILA